MQDWLLAQRSINHDLRRRRHRDQSVRANDSERIDIITSDAYGEKLRSWLAIDDSVYGAYLFGCKPGEPLDRVVLLESLQGVDAEETQRRVRAWLATTHEANTP